MKLTLLSLLNHRYSAFDALQLVSDMDDYFHCEHCKGELRPESEKLTLDEIVCGGGNAIKHTHDKLKDMHQRMEVITFYSVRNLLPNLGA